MRCHDVFDVKKETRLAFIELAARYGEKFQSPRGLRGLTYYLVDGYRAAFGNRRLPEIGYLDLETCRNRRRETSTGARKPRTDATVNQAISTWQHTLNKAVEWGHAGK